MKTPREILFERHRSIEPKLDGIRRAAVAGLRARRFSVRAKGASVLQVLRSFRWHLAGMSAAWVLVVMLNFEKESASTAASAVRRAPSAGTLLAAIRESRRLLLDLMELSVPPAVGPGPKDPQRRGGLRVMTILAHYGDGKRAAPEWMDRRGFREGRC